MSKERPKTVKWKVNISWIYAFYYLDELRGYPVLQEDERFKHLFAELFDYVDEKIKPPQKGDILDTYAVIEQEII